MTWALRQTHLVAAAVLWVGLAGCAVPRPPAQVQIPTPDQWHAPLPHGGQTSDLARWWDQWNDPLLTRLMAAAQEVSPTRASAQSRLLQARATRGVAAAALSPQVDATVSAARADQLATGLANQAQAGAQASWELDLFGAQRLADDAAQARLAGAQAGWHEARVSVAAETALVYVRLRSCEQLRNLAQEDAASRTQTAQLAQRSAQAGFTATAQAALARAGAAEGSARVRQQQAGCDVERKTLVALTGVAEPELLRDLAAPWRAPAADSGFAVAVLPAQVLTQRPDLRQAELAVAAASADVGAALADRYPRLTLSGAVAVGAVSRGGSTRDAPTWSIGPMALSLPLWDGGRRAANAEAAQARYQEAVSLYRARARQAVSEVEQAGVHLHSAQTRSLDLRGVAQDLTTVLTATESRHRAGLASLVELEDARRSQLAAQTALVNLQQDRLAAWISLYRAAGGGWQREAGAPAPRPAPAQK